MKRMALLVVLATVTCGLLPAQEVPHTVASQVNCAVQPQRFEQWYQQSRLSAGEPYVAGAKRKQQILDNYRRLKLQMHLDEVQRLLGKPDFGTARPPLHLSTAPEPADLRCTNDLAYIVRKDTTNMADADDVGIYLSFSRDGKLSWAMPQNLPDLKPLGSPAAVVK